MINVKPQSFYFETQIYIYFKIKIQNMLEY